MARLSELRDRRRAERLERLGVGCSAVLRDPGEELWLFGSWARGDWDSRSDVDLLAIPLQPFTMAP